jgi:heavy metal translocating P-type ATPase
MNSAASKPPATAVSATCDYCGLPVPAPALPGEIAYCCYGCRFAATISATDAETAAMAGPASALGFSVFFTMNVVMLTMALWSYADNSDSPFQEALGHFLRYGAMAFALPVLLLLGRPLLSHALQGLRRKMFSTDLLLASGVLAAFAVSVINTWRGTGQVYYEVGCVILVFVTGGRWLEAVGRSRASAALDELERLVPDTVRRRDWNRDVLTPRNTVIIGDHLHILAGERIPLDGRVWQGRGVVDEQFFTGESIPVEKQPGDSVLGGSLNLDGDLVIEVTAPPHEGALGRLVEAVRSARLSKGRYQLLSDAWSQRFLPIIGVIAITAFFVHGVRVNWGNGLLTALSVILVACPCALALATPLAAWTALGTAAKKGVLFRSGKALETLAGVRAIRWDKTGTLTTGSPRVTRLICENVADQDQVEFWAAFLAKASRHVFSQAVHEFLTDDSKAPRGVEGLSSEASKLPFRDGLQTVPGRGLRMPSPDGRWIALGSIRWMNQCGLAWGPNLSAVLADPATADSPVTAIGFEGCVQGLFLLEENLRPEAVDAVERCRKWGLNQAMLTGDRHLPARRLAALLTKPGLSSGPVLDVAAELPPEEKLAAIRAAQQQFGCVAMVGDGLNDAPALAAADVGIALGCGADVSRDSADLCLLSSDLALVPWAFEFSRQAVRTIRTNLAWSFAYNSIGVVVAATGQLHPALAAALMVLSSVIVLANSLRLSATGSSLSSHPGDGRSAIPPSGPVDCEVNPLRAVT